MKKFLSFILTVLGFAGCNDDDGPYVNSPNDSSICMYGVPTVDYCIKGKVVDNADKPVEKIVVSFVNYSILGSYQDFYSINNCDTTDATGNYSITDQSFPFEEDITVSISLRDINEIHSPDTLYVNFTSKDLNTDSSDSWNKGCYEKTIDIKLKD